MRYIVFFYTFLIDDKREGNGSLWLKDLEQFPSNKRLCELICETAKGEPLLEPHHVVVTGWNEMTKEDYENFCRIDTIHRIAVDNVQDCTFDTYCGLNLNAFDDRLLTSNTDYNCPECIAEIEKVKENIKMREFNQLKDLCKELLIGADMCSKPPHFIVQPFFNIVKKYARLINKLELWKSET